MSTCRACGVEKDPVLDFYKGHTRTCKRCILDQAKEAFRSGRRTRPKPAPEIEVARTRKWKVGHKDRARLMGWAHNRVLRAIASGLLTRPDSCSRCGATAFIEAAHEDYNRPLDVTWLCRRCHRAFDHANPKSVVDSSAYTAVKRYRNRVWQMCDEHKRMEFFAESCSVCGKSVCLVHDPTLRWFVCKVTEATARMRDRRSRLPRRGAARSVSGHKQNPAR